jgi:hypothetical protein
MKESPRRTTGMSQGVDAATGAILVIDNAGSAQATATARLADGSSAALY